MSIENFPWWGAELLVHRSDLAAFQANVALPLAKLDGRIHASSTLRVPKRIDADLVAGVEVSGPGNVNRTRSVEMVWVMGMVEEAIAKAGKVIAKKKPSARSCRTGRAGGGYGIGAVEYTDLSTTRIGGYAFETNHMVALLVDTGIDTAAPRSMKENEPLCSNTDSMPLAYPCFRE